MAGDDVGTTLEDSPLTLAAADLLTNDTDPDGDTLTITAVTDPPNGSASIDVSGDVVYIPDPDFSGVDTFTYQVCDPTGACDTATITVTVDPDNDPPVAIDDTATTVEDTPVNVTVLANDSDPEGDLLTVTQIVTAPTNGSAVINPDGTITYTPNPNFTGVDGFQYEISDGNGGTATAFVSFILVTPVNDDPVANDDPATTDEDTPVTVPVLGNDTDLDGDALTVQSVTQPANGTTVINPDNTITYTPDPDYFGNRHVRPTRSPTGTAAPTPPPSPSTSPRSTTTPMPVDDAATRRPRTPPW